MIACYMPIHKLKGANYDEWILGGKLLEVAILDWMNELLDVSKIFFVKELDLGSAKDVICHGSSKDILNIFEDSHLLKKSCFQ